MKKFKNPLKAEKHRKRRKSSNAFEEIIKENLNEKILNEKIFKYQIRNLNMYVIQPLKPLKFWQQLYILLFTEGKEYTEDGITYYILRESEIQKKLNLKHWWWTRKFEIWQTNIKKDYIKIKKDGVYLGVRKERVISGIESMKRLGLIKVIEV